MFHVLKKKNILCAFGNDLCPLCAYRLKVRCYKMPVLT